MDIRQAIGGRVRGLVGSGEIDLSRPAGDPGLFGPGSATWAVHGDFTGMMIGGVCSLLVQMLHPAALAGGVGPQRFPPRHDRAAETDGAVHLDHHLRVHGGGGTDDRTGAIDP